MRQASIPALASAIALACVLTPRAAAAADADLAAASVVTNAVAEKADSSSEAAAQSASRRGGVLRGRVTDPSGAAIQNARVEATGPAGARSATSDATGSWTIDRLRPGST